MGLILLLQADCYYIELKGYINRCLANAQYINRCLANAQYSCHIVSFNSLATRLICSYIVQYQLEHHSSYGIITRTKVADIIGVNQDTMTFSPLTLLGARMN